MTQEPELSLEQHTMKRYFSQFLNVLVVFQDACLEVMNM